MFTPHARLTSARAWWHSVLLILVLLPFTAAAQLQELKLTADDATGDDHYGRTMAMSGDRLAIGAMTTNGGDGAVYVYDRSGDDWLLDEKIDGPGRTGFGRSSAYVYWGYTDGTQGLIVSNIPGQAINAGESFSQIVLDDYVSHDTYLDEEMSWAASGQVELEVTIDIDRVATVTAFDGWIGSSNSTGRFGCRNATTCISN